ncbi:hypothetical protein OQZ33_22775 [Pedobacter sp. MC2016-05]|uniref:MauE/DoxX family redox-associated membrane protein n=1 Tax=Pedobacter sp. MC2016-05 TaxID=2994474 RepID=UPI002245B004|nr:MauE/DoxX family redox-associated membrane protein [Pedobacter sp. MC2016-05]MCX2477176.1 hypothetical protein [Pedobacter sp. MC2016-05]
MDTKFQNSPQKNSSLKWMGLIVDLAVYSYILLFFYTAFSKLITYSAFLKVLSDLPLIGAWHQAIAMLVIFLEVLFGVLLVIPGGRIKGLWMSLGLMMLFTFYLGYHVMLRSKLPCSCGGVISGMTWPQHVAFNVGFILLAVAGIMADRRMKQ